MFSISSSDSVVAISEFKKIKSGEIGWAAFAIKQIQNSSRYYLDVIHSVQSDNSEQSRPDNFEKNIWKGLVDWSIKSMATKPCFIVADVKGVKDGKAKKRIFLLYWCPEGKISTQEKMLYSTNKEIVRQLFMIAGGPFDVESADDLQLENFYSQL